MRQIIDLIELKTGVDVSKKSRMQVYADLRSVYYKILREKYKMNLQDIGDTIHKHHTTVLYGYKNFDIVCKYYPKAREVYDDICYIIDKEGLPDDEIDILDQYRLTNILLNKKIDELTNHKNRKLIELVDLVPSGSEGVVYDRMEAIVKMLRT